PLRRFSPGLKAQFAFGMVFLFVQPDASAADISAQQIGGVIIPTFSQSASGISASSAIPSPYHEV
ncbi:hypothetical protein F7F69_28845, partial [Escherichia coli]